MSPLNCPYFQPTGASRQALTFLSLNKLHPHTSSCVPQLLRGALRILYCLFLSLATRTLLQIAETASRWKESFYGNTLHLNYMHCLPMFIASHAQGVWR